jgi:hypothetical protein
MSDITMAAFEALIEKAYNLKAQKEALEDKAKEIGSELLSVQNQILEYMTEFDKTSYKSKFGTIVKVEKLSVKTPKDPDSKAAFFAWLEGKGIKDEILNINSQTLNSLYKQELEAAAQRGDTEFSIPGIDLPTVFHQITMRK